MRLRNFSTGVSSSATGRAMRRALTATSMLWSASLTAQAAIPVSFGRYSLDVWRAQDGVRLAYTSNLVLTRDGYLWLSCESGVTRFDGARFKVFDGTVSPALRGRPRLQTTPLLEDGNGTLLIGTDIGLLAYAQGVIRPAALNATFQIDQVNAATVDVKGTVWAVTRSGRVFRIPRTGGLHEVSGTILSYSGSSLSVDPSGDVWIAAGQNAVYRVRHDTLSHVTFPPEVRVDDPNRAYAAPDSSIWFGTPTAVIRWKAGRVTRFELPRRAGLGAVSAIAAAPDGMLWIGTHGAGLYRFDGRRFEPFTSRDGLSDDRVIDILPDARGNIWVATRDGLNRFRPVPFDVITARDGLPTALPGGMIRDATGSAWLAPPTGGVFRGRVTNGRASFTTVEAVRNYDRVSALARGAHGSVWAGHLLGSVTQFDGAEASARVFADQLPPITDIHEDVEGTVWVGTWRGLFRLGGGRRDSLTKRDGLPDDFIHRIHRDASGTLWVATQTGIARAEGGGDRRFVVQRMPENSANRAVLLFEAPAGTLWLGSAEGLTRVSGGRTAHLTTAHGLPESWIGAAELDDAGNLWLGQLGGLTRLRLDELRAVADGRLPALTAVSTFRVLDGLPGGDPGAWPHPWSFRGGGGELWFAMGHGLAIIDPARVKSLALPPAMHVEEVAIDGVAQPALQVVEVSPSARRLAIRYTGAELTDGPQVRFRYRLDSYDTTWTDAGTQRVATFSRLPAGTYRFRVSSRMANGEWSPAEAAMSIVVQAPVYRRPWFLAIAVLVVAALLSSAHLWRLGTKSAAIRDERSRLAREIHDSLLQGFGGIALELHAASARLALPAEQQGSLDRVLGLIDRTLTQARDVVWDIRQPGDGGSDLAAAIEGAGDRIFNGSETALRVRSTGTPRSIEPQVRSECLRIVEEAMTNVRRHAFARDAVVELHYTWLDLTLVVRDHGIGFDPAVLGKEGGHWGLLGIRERASRIGAALRLDSTPGEGTALIVVVPIRWRMLPRWRRETIRRAY